MAQNIVFFAKPTTLVEGTYYSDPFDISAFKSLTIQVMFLEGQGTSPTVTGQLQQGSDLTTWTDSGSTIAPTEGNVSTQTQSDLARYVRLKVTIGGSSSPAAAMWAKAVAREN